MRQHMPPYDQQCVTEWLEGFFHAHADYCGDTPSQGFPFDAELLRIAATLYVYAHEMGLLERYVNIENELRGGDSRILFD